MLGASKQVEVGNRILAALPREQFIPLLQKKILDHPLLGEAEERQLLYDWNEVAPTQSLSDCCTSCSKIKLNAHPTTSRLF